MDGQSPSIGGFDLDAAIKRYQQLITQLPPLNRQLLLYILDLLAVFASKSDLNKMTTPNLSAIFQPGILSHPDHDMAPNEYRLSQDVLIFLIENQDHFLIGMQGTAADQKTVQEVESGPPTPQVRTAGGKLSKTLGRTGSSASKYSGIIRRSVSVSSRKSRGSVGPSPVTSLHSPGTPVSPAVGGVHRSNTVPSKKSPGVGTGRFQREHPSDPPTPGSTRQGYGFVPGAFPEDADSQYLAAQTAHRHPAPPEVISPSSSEDTTPIARPSVVQAAPPANDSKPQLMGEPEKSKGAPGPIPIPAPGANVSGPTGQVTPTNARATLTSLLSGKSPPGDGRQPNKLRKKRMPGSANPSAHSSQNSLSGPLPEPEGYQASIPASTGSNMPLLNAQSPGGHLHPMEQGTPVPLKPTMSPTGSFRSHSTATDPDQTLIPTDASAPPSLATADSLREPYDPEQSAEKEKKRRGWFLRNKDTPDRDRTMSQSGFVPPNPPFAANETAQRSRSSIVTEGTAGRKSTNIDRSTSNAVGSPESYGTTQQAPHAPIPLNDPSSAGSDRESREKNPLKGWIKGKLAERAEKKEERDRLKEEEKRTRSPPGGSREHRRGLSASMQSLTAQMTGEAGRSGKSMDIPRRTRDERQTGKSMDLQREPPPPAPLTTRTAGPTAPTGERERELQIGPPQPQVVMQQAQPEPRAAVVASEALKRMEGQGQGPGGPSS
jgi:GTPase-activating protein SAC7